MGVVHLQRRDWQIAAALAAAVVILAGASSFVATACGSFHDDAIYVSTARSLADGTGYNLINLPGAPPQTKYPFLYPLLLAIVMKMAPGFPGNLWMMQSLTLVTAGLAIGVAYLYLVRFGYASRSVALGAAALAATTPFLLYISTRVLSEMPFALLLVAALWRVDRALERGPASRVSQLLTGAIVALPYLCRSVGAVLIVAVPLVLLLRRRPFFWTSVGTAVAAAPWVYWSLTALGQWQQNSTVGYYTDYLGSWSILTNDAFAVVVRNLLHLLLSPLTLSLTGFISGAYSGFGWRLSPILLLLGLIPWIAVLLRAVRLQLLGVFLLLNGLLLVAWPWPPARFLLPILPFLLALAGPAVVAVGRAVLPSFHRTILWACLGLFLVANLTMLGRIGVLVRATDFPFFSIPGEPADWTGYEDVLSWLRDNTDPTDTVASALDSMVFLYAQRQSFRPFPYRPDRLFYSVPGPKSGTASELLEALTANRAKYLAMFPLPGFVEEHAVGQVIAELRRVFPERLVPVFIGRDPRFVVFEVR